jgi:hypothetical protein
MVSPPASLAVRSRLSATEPWARTAIASIADTPSGTMVSASTGATNCSA